MPIVFDLVLTICELAPPYLRHCRSRVVEKEEVGFDCVQSRRPVVILHKESQVKSREFELEPER